VPRWDNAPQAHSRVSNINVDIYKYPMKNISRTAKFFPVKDPGNTFNLAKCGEELCSP
jgi:hypothetical protein